MVVHFPPFQADLADERLWHGAHALPLTHKAWGVLRVLLESEGRLVTKDHLVTAVWEDANVGDDSITKSVGELRRVLGDDQRAPNFIATVHGRGYRFVAPVWSREVRPVPAPSAVVSPALIGRERELSVLTGWLESVRQGQRQVGFVSGEVGIGKSSLVTAFIDAAVADPSAPVHIAAGQCIEQYGEAEPFLPVIAALRRLARNAVDAAILHRVAPPWLATACGLVPIADAAAAVLTRAGVLRTLAEVIETLAADAALVFVLEDLHWSDPSTLDLVNLLARRNDPGRLLVLCTLRRSEALAAGHGSAMLLRELRRTGRCEEIVVEGLSRPDVDDYVSARLTGGEPPSDAAEYLVRHTGGNPFFLGALIDDLLARGTLRRENAHWELDADATPPSIPSESLAALAPRLERLSDIDRAMLEAASVAGDDFVAEIVAGVLAEEHDVCAEDVETVCERLVRHQDMLRGGERDGSYLFRHALYRQALYDGIMPARRRHMHRRVGKMMAAARAPGSLDGAAELAEHFARAGDHPEACRYHAQAADAARLRFADREVAAHLGAALAHLRRSPRTADHDAHELMLLQQYAAALLTANGVGDGAVAELFRRGQTLARRINAPLAHFAASAGLFFFHLIRAELIAATKIAAELTAAAPSLPLPVCAAAARAAFGTVLLCRGELIAARQHLDGLRGAFPRRDANSPLDGAAWYLGVLSMLYVGLGEVEAARATCADLLISASDASPFDLAIVHMLVAGVEAQLHNAPVVIQHADSAARIGAEHESPVLVSAAGQLRGWAMATMGDVTGGIALLNDGEAAWRTSGQRLGVPLFAMLRAEAYLCADDRRAAQAAIDAGLEHAHATGEHRYDSDLYRLRAECLRRTGHLDAAAGALQTALNTAALQHARLAELRAAIEHMRMNQANDAGFSAAKRLAAVAGSFNKGARLPELSVAAALLCDPAVVPLCDPAVVPPIVRSIASSYPAQD